ncbi:putative zeta-carotene isomerase [Medicago truncatula]|uniref:Putative zeta-carotene isomerase n=1 Tax=Medicago truncatula TaxID=3880 RepID=A0A396GUM6_MEDTR|nr:putative zeta-carotene isomerase [Medicago truncatula]
MFLVLISAGVHSGLASFRDTCEKLIGDRAYRVRFAGTSLPLYTFFLISCRKTLLSSMTCAHIHSLIP